MNSNLQAEETIKVELIHEVPLENKTQVVATEQVLVQLITLKMFSKLWFNEFSHADGSVYGDEIRFLVQSLG